MRFGRQRYGDVALAAGLVFAGLGLWPAAPTGKMQQTSDLLHVTYRLCWDVSGSTSPAAGGWRTLNDLGYEVQVDQGYLVNYSMQLVRVMPPAGDAVIATARAGHGDVADPLACEAILAESLLESETVEAGTRSGVAGRFEQVHYLVARGTADTATPEGASLQGVSLSLEGRYRAPGEESWETFRIRTSMANGVQWPLEEQLALPEGGEVVVEIVRRRSTLFNGMNFAGDERALSWQILRNLVADSRMRVRVDE